MKKNKIIYWVPVVLWASVIFWFSSLPTNPVSTVYWQEFAVKKTAHMVEYSIFTIFLYRAFKNTFSISGSKLYWITPLISAVYGITDEIHQMFTPGREPTVRDAIFDTIGTVLAMIFILKILPVTQGPVKSLAKKFEIL